MSSTVFDHAAPAYDRLRPTYPSEVYDAIERLGGVPLAGALVVEVGAGTGIATRGLRARGAKVLAVDLSLAMLRIQGDVPARAAARGERLPVRDDAADLVCAATSWHWVESAAGLADAVRVLRPGGALAVWWNRLADRDSVWCQAREESLRRRGRAWNGCYAIDGIVEQLNRDLRASDAFGSIEQHDAWWDRTVSIEDHLGELATHSSVIQLGAAAGAYIEEQRAVLAREFPDGTIRERYVCQLQVAKVRA
jgi:SAM-dependent methyltransferase